MNRFAFLAVALIATAPLSARAQDTPAPAPSPAPPASAPAAPPDPALPAPNQPQGNQPAKPRQRFTLGPEVGFYLPSSGRTREAFGSTWFNYGISFRPIELIPQKGRLSFDLNIVSTSGSGRRALLIPASIIYKRALTNGEPGKGFRLYTGASAGLLIADLRSDNHNVHSGFRGGAAGSLLLGTTITTKAFVEVRYNLFSKIKGYDLSGFGISTGYRF